MGFKNKLTFLDAYEKLCKEHGVYIDIPYGKTMYLMEILGPVDKSFEKTIEKLEADLG